MNKEKLKKDFIDKLDNKFILKSDYINSKTKVTLLHKECNREFSVLPTNFIYGGKKCLQCHKDKMIKRYSKTTKEFKEDIKRLVGDEYEMDDEYINCHSKVKMKHNKCGKTYMVAPTDFLSGYRCPKCKHSEGENIIRKWLTENNFSFEEQFSFKDCIYKRPLKFDFKININNDFILLEYDGIQHFKKMWYDKNFEDQQKRDKIKNEYCKKNNITLIRIDYTKFDNIKEILIETFNDYRNQ